jgi:hypothetical protein
LILSSYVWVCILYLYIHNTHKHTHYVYSSLSFVHVCGVIERGGVPSLSRCVYVWG